MLCTRGIEEGGWRPDHRGAKLSTYFLGSCVLCFANAYRKQLATCSWAAHDVLVGGFDWDGSSVPSVEEVALAKIDVDAAFADCSALSQMPGLGRTRIESVCPAIGQWCTSGVQDGQLDTRPVGGHR